MFPFSSATVGKTQRTVLSEALFAYRMRWKRRRLLHRSWKRRGEIDQLSGGRIPRSGVLVFSTMRNEMLRIDHWLDHYRALGVAHFLIVDNASDDGTAAHLARQPDVSLWTTSHSYKAARFGVDWLTCLQRRHGAGRWCLTVDADELLVYPGCDTRDLNALTRHLEQSGRDAFGALMLDLYPKGPVAKTPFAQGQDPIAALPYFDADNYRATHHGIFDNLWIQGGVRDRVFFGSQPDRAPTLNKTPLVKWRRGYAYVTSTHQILPRRLNDVFEYQGGSRVSGVLLHTKFLPSIATKSAEDLARREHFENSDLYTDYYTALTQSPDLWCDRSVRFEGPAQLERLGLMTRGTFG